MCSLINTLGSSGYCKPNGKRKMPYFVLFALFFFCLPAKAQYGGGTGTQNDPYLIRTAEQMNAIGARPGDWHKHFQLRADIDMGEYTGTEYNIIGTDTQQSFGGVFDGNDHTISNLSLRTTHQWYTGLFGCVIGQIKNLALISPDIFAQGGKVGSLVGGLEEGSVTSCYVEKARVSGDNYIGGLVGSTSARIVYCYSTGTVSGNTYVGGLDDKQRSKRGQQLLCHRQCQGRHLRRRTHRASGARQSIQVLFDRQRLGHSARRRLNGIYTGPGRYYALLLGYPDQRLVNQPRRYGQNNRRDADNEHFYRCGVGFLEYLDDL